MAQRKQVVYFIADPCGAIKIGKTFGDPAKRLYDIQGSNPRKLTIVYATAALVEYLVHERFAHIRLRREWFADTQELRNFIEAQRDEDRADADAKQAHTAVAMTRLLDAHPDGWEGPCECRTCVGHASKEEEATE